MILKNPNGNLDTSLTLWEQLALEYIDQLQPDYRIVIHNFETKNKTKYHHTTTDFIIKLLPNGKITVLDKIKESKEEQKYNFIKSISNITNLETKTNIDVLAVIHKLNPIQHIPTRYNTS